MIQSFVDDFHLCFVKNARYEYLLSGLGVTLEVALAAINATIAELKANGKLAKWIADFTAESDKLKDK